MEATQALLRGDLPPKEHFVVYPLRWLILFIFVLSGFANALVLLTWSPISDKASDFWGGIGPTAVNLLAVAFQIMYLPGTVLAVNVMKKADIRVTMMLGGSLTAVGCGIRYLGAIARVDGGMSSLASYVIVLLGTVVVAAAQPFYLNMPAKIAASWFAVRERDISTTICSLANPLGSAIGSLLPAMFVSGEGHHVSGISNLLLVQLIIAAVALFLTCTLFSNAPPSPPSASAQDMAAQRSEGLIDGRKGNFKLELRQLFRNTEYMKLFFAFTVSLGNLNALAALLNQLPGDYSNAEAGNLGAVLIMSGFVGAFATGFLLDYTKAFFVLAVLSWAFFASNCRADNYALLLTSAALLGVTLLPTIPATIVNSVECAYPVSEDVALGLLYAAANILAIVMTFAGQVLLSMDSFGPAPLFPYGMWVIGTMGVVLIPVLLYEGQYLRLVRDTGPEYIIE